MPPSPDDHFAPVTTPTGRAISQHNAIELRRAGKRYTKYEDTPMLLTSALHLGRRTRRNKLWAVRGVDLEVGEGQSMGIIGRNGSGKTTLMSMMAGITAPSVGSVRVWGRVAPLIAVGVGFHRELTGRENIYVNGTMLGLSRRQIDRRLDAVIDFAEIEDFIDTPVKFYSSGMYVRLGFSVAVHSDPSVLLIDEVLAVGDLAFQVKCFERMGEILTNGTTIVVISHNMGGVVRVCQRALVLHDGRPQFLGAPTEAISRFHELLSNETEMQIDHESGSQLEPGVATLEGVEMVSADGSPANHITSGEPVALRVTVRATQPVEDPVIGLSVLAPDGTALYVDSSAGHRLGSIGAGEAATYAMSFRAQLPTGSYTVLAWVQRPDRRTLLAQSRPLAFFVAGRSTVGGVADLEATFQQTADEASVPGLVTGATANGGGVPGGLATGGAANGAMHGSPAPGALVTPGPLIEEVGA